MGPDLNLEVGKQAVSVLEITPGRRSQDWFKISLPLRKWKGKVLRVNATLGGTKIVEGETKINSPYRTRRKSGAPPPKGVWKKRKLVLQVVTESKKAKVKPFWSVFHNCNSF